MTQTQKCSVLDQLESSQVDVYSTVRPDIFGSEFSFKPLTYRYLFIIPFEQVDIVSIDFRCYVSDVDYLFSGFVDKYQIMLRKLGLGSSPYEMFPEISLKEQRMFGVKYSDMPDSQKFSAAMFIQFDLEKDWTYKKIYRFLKGLTKILDVYECLEYKTVHLLYRQQDIRNLILIENELYNDWKSVITNITDVNVYAKYNENAHIEFEMVDNEHIQIIPEKCTLEFDKIEIVRNEWNECIMLKDIRFFKHFFVDFITAYDYAVAPSTLTENRANIVMKLDLKMNGSAKTLPEYKKFVRTSIWKCRTHAINQKMKNK